MTLFRLLVALAVLGAGGGTAAAQSAVPPPPTTVQVPELPPDSEQIIYARPLVRIGMPLTLGPGAAARDAVVILSDAAIAGRVLGDVVVVLGNLRLDPSAVVEGAVVVVGGHARIADGASIGDDFVVVGGSVDAPVNFMPNGEQVIVGPPGLGAALRDVAPWVTRGLLWGRVIVPDLGWTWPIVALVLLVNIAILLALPRAVLACTEVLTARPAGAFFAGLLTLLLFPPVVTILAISVVGIVIIPFVCCALVLGWMLGKVGVARWIGAGVVREDEPDRRAQALRSMFVGFALIVLAYMIPIVGLAAWAMVGVFGLGAATLTVTAGLRRERPVAAPRPAAPSGPPVTAPPVAPPHGVSESVPPAPAASVSAAAVGPASPFVASAPIPEPEPPPYVPPAASTFASMPPPAASSHTAAAADGRVDLTTFPRATFRDRFFAAVLDVILVMIGYNLLDWWNDGRAFLVLLLGYHIVFWMLKGTTVGGIIFNLRVVRTDGAALTPSDALVRGLTSLLSAAAVGLGFFWILRDPERQAWHDRVAGTYVVAVPRHWPLP